MSQGHGRAFDRAQKAHDDQEPPNDFYDCNEDGHEWRFRRAAFVNGIYIREFKCVICQKLATEDEI